MVSQVLESASFRVNKSRRLSHGDSRRITSRVDAQLVNTACTGQGLYDCAKEGTHGYGIHIPTVNAEIARGA